MKVEKEIIRLTEIHQNTDKRDLIQNINCVLKSKGIGRNRKVQWISKVTGSPEGTIYTWFTNAKCRKENKIPLYVLCQMALALKVSVYEFFELEGSEQENRGQKIDRRSKLYWHLRRDVAEGIWNSTHTMEENWQEQTMETRREFLDRLYLEEMNEKNENTF